MKKILMAAALTVFATAPALAQQGTWGAPQMPTQYGAPGQSYMYGPAQAYAQPGMGAGFAGSAPGVVIENGIVVGQDPDADVRLQLRREAQTGQPELLGAPASGFGVTF